MKIGFTLLDIKNSLEAQTALQQIGCDPKGVQIMKSKAVFQVIKLTNVRTKAANLLKQTFLAKGADAAVARGSADLSSEYTDVLLMATLKQYRQAVASLKMQPWGLPQAARQIENALHCLEQGQDTPNPAACWGRRAHVDKGCSFIVADIDVAQTAYDAAAASQKIKEMRAEGAHVIRFVTEGAKRQVNEKDELIQLLPFLQKVMSFSDVPMMIKTNKIEVMKAVLEYGVDFIDMYGGFLGNPEVLPLLAQHKIPVVITFRWEKFLSSHELMKEICLFLQKSITIGSREGIDAADIIFAPYGSFFENFEDNFRIIEQMGQLRLWGCPLLMNFDGIAGQKHVLELSSRERDEIFLAALTLSKMNGAQFFCGNQISTFKNILNTLSKIGRVEKNDEDYN